MTDRLTDKELHALDDHYFGSDDGEEGFYTDAVSDIARLLFHAKALRDDLDALTAAVRDVCQAIMDNPQDPFGVYTGYETDLYRACAGGGVFDSSAVEGPKP